MFHRYFIALPTCMVF